MLLLMNVFLESVIPNKLMICCVPIIYCRVVFCLSATLLVLFRTLSLICECRDCSYFCIISVLSVYHVFMFYVYRDGE